MTVHDFTTDRDRADRDADKPFWSDIYATVFGDEAGSTMLPAV